MRKRRPPVTPREAALAFLNRYFDEHPDGGWVKEIVADAEKEGIGDQTLRRAAKTIGVERVSAGQKGAIWRLAGERS